MDSVLPSSPSSKKLKQIQGIDDLEFLSENAESQTQLDKLDSPPGVEASSSRFGVISVAFTKTITAIKSLCISDQLKTGVKEIAKPSSSSNHHDGDADKLDSPPGVDASSSCISVAVTKTITAIKSLCISDLPETEGKEIATSSLALTTFHAESSSSTNYNDVIMEISRFDVVDAFSDHHYAKRGFKRTQPPKNWAKKIQEEWKILMNNLPETIFVRVCETRMELLRAVLVGPTGTPYHDGLFVFDCLFPTDYPNSPPSVHYYSGGLCLNPNLYSGGKVCLSLLGTWSGRKEENWMPGKSTMLQVLVSIQALVLNEKPFFNEPGYERITGAEGLYRSKKYNEKVFIRSLRTMIYTMKNPPEHFKELVVQHFRGRARNILMACKAYSAGVSVGSDLSYSTTKPEVNVSKKLKSSIPPVMSLLITSFSQYGINCNEF